MRSAMVVVLLAFVTIASAQKSAPRPPAGDWEHTMWVDGTLTAIESVQAGMPRETLEKLFHLQLKEGFQTAPPAWVYNECPYIRVDVEFSKDGKTITSISRPYLARPNYSRWGAKGE